MARRFDAAAPDFAVDFAAFLAEPRGGEPDVAEVAAAIVADVRALGFPAVAELTERLDGWTPTEESVRVTPARVEEAVASCDGEDLAALRLAAERVRAYHRRQRPSDHRFMDDAGVELGWRWTPLESVGLYVPGGRAAYPSSVLMNAIPAKVAGVERLAMVAPTPGGVLHPLVLAAAREAGVDEIYAVGGAQAVAALAYGAGPIRPVDKIVGPGN
ncbi:MAG: histidinol dehydrogenase, partial [Caulobacterales bacterium]|nr:histidinol dehydrogenase [Caulobacterales bacterium]